MSAWPADEICRSSEPARTWFDAPPRLRLEPETTNPVARNARLARALDDPSIRRALIGGYRLPRSYLEGYYDRRVFPRLDRPDFVPTGDGDRFYRGMYLTLDELQNVLRNGLETARTSWHAGGASGVSFSTSMDEAATYIFQSPRSVEGIGVVLVVRDVDQIEPCPRGELNPCGTIFHSPTDVPPGEIIDVCLWGRWGLERIDDVLALVSAGEVIPHTDWTGVFTR